MRARFAFVVAVAVAALALATPATRAQDLGQPFRPPAEAPKAAPKLTKAPQILHAVQPNYPPEALASRASADVTMMVDIDATGKVTKVAGRPAATSASR